MQSYKKWNGETVLEQLLNHIGQHQLCEPEDKILLAVSGGIDSMVMLHLFQRTRFFIAVAHCNFQLRGKESDEEERFVQSCCDVAAIPFHVKRFDTAAYADENRLSVQGAARELRYAFFEDLVQEYGYRYLATAHHHSDNLETVLFNLLRGTGIDGLAGIPMKNQNIIRPLLFATRQEIVQYAVAHKLDWREDSSNQSVDYQRNFLRHHIIPLLKNINPNLEESFRDTVERLQGAKAFRDVVLDTIRKTLVQRVDNQTWIHKNILTDYPAPVVVLWELIKAYGFLFDQCKQIAKEHQPGKKFYSATHQLTIDRDHLIVNEIAAEPEVRTRVIDRDEREVTFGNSKLAIEVLAADVFTLTRDSSIAQLDADKVEFPLTWRFWRSGDSFHPLGMEHTKKLSDFFIDLKVSLPQKENITVLESGENITWVVGLRIDERFKVTDQTKRVLVIRLLTRQEQVHRS